MKFPQTIQLDASDQYIFDNVAQPGEWAVSGAFAFAGDDVDPNALDGADEIAFATAFMGCDSFGWSTVVVVKEISNEGYQAVVAALADHFLTHYSAPNRQIALAAAAEEAEFAASLCLHPINTLLGIERSLGDDGITEQFRIIAGQDESAHGTAWDANKTER
ncbi:MAG: hypothetical protein HOK21_25235 [Rhodospirillaceae bacterium]|jgi:hypothetical protein|nr:hypothetical protein [Rhodospirillaceae bacterium]MBT4045538.1 hypothetical protein [Rhodospirillaceae bacterium]MBT4688070.1 hypothetical protein [Rhodospirillaceae bacterium]MBT5081734.1 hypothetical protein [Rhodospirillaceae bacterium]MBT5527404.1 hypothetical protein [Rhodospirillaceae bacterium]